MRICTLNLNWANRQSSQTHINKIEKSLLETNSEIIIVTESVDSLFLKGYSYVYKTNKIPPNTVYEDINYTKYLNGETAIRVAIYSKNDSSHSYPVKDATTSICNSFNTEIGSMTIYATIVGTRFNKKPYAEQELSNCIDDCISISKLTDDLCIAGDLNTSFIDTELHYEIKGIKSRKELINLCEICDVDLTTGRIEQNIDHILLSNKFSRSHKFDGKVFVEKGLLSDHKGVLVEISPKSNGSKSFTRL
jgi:hypothetical protein